MSVSRRHAATYRITPEEILQYREQGYLVLTEEEMATLM